MKRRSFLTVFGLLPTIPFSRLQEKSIPEYEYDWQSGESTDPECRILPYAEYAPRIFLDGRVMNDSGLKITRCKSGLQGWIEYLECNADGTVKHCNLSLVRALLHGRVEVKPLAAKTTHLNTGGNSHTYAYVGEA